MDAKGQALLEQERQEREMAARHGPALKKLHDDLLTALGKWAGYCATVTDDEESRFLQLVYARMLFGEAGHAFIDVCGADSVLKNLDVARDMMLAGLATAAGESIEVVERSQARGTIPRDRAALMVRELKHLKEETLSRMSSSQPTLADGPAPLDGGHRGRP